MSVTQVSSTSQFQSYLSNNRYVVVDFFATWCPPCKMIAPVLDKLAKQNSDAGNLAFLKVDVDQQQDLARQYGITAMPTFLVFKNGQVTQTIRGANPPALTSAVQTVSQAVKAEAQTKQQATAASAGRADDAGTVSGDYTLNKGVGWKMSLN